MLVCLFVPLLIEKVIQGFLNFTFNFGAIHFLGRKILRVENCGWSKLVPHKQPLGIIKFSGSFNLGDERFRDKNKCLA